MTGRISHDIRHGLENTVVAWGGKPEGFTAISRRLSGAIPPVPVDILNLTNPKGSQPSELRSFQDRHHHSSAIRWFRRETLLNHRLMAVIPIGMNTRLAKLKLARALEIDGVKRHTPTVI